MKRLIVLIFGLAAGSLAPAQGTHDMDMKAMQNHKALQPGHKIDFQFVQHGKDYVITEVR